MADSQTLESNIIIRLEDATGNALSSIGAKFRALAAKSGIPKISSALTDVGRSLRGVAEAAAPVVEALTAITGVGVIGGLAGLVEALKSSAESLDVMSKQSRQIGLTIQGLRQFQFIAERQGVAWESAAQGLTHASRAYFEIHRGIGRAAAQLQKFDPMLGMQIRSANNSAQAFDRMLGAIHAAIAAGNHAKAIKLSELFFGTSDFTKIAELANDEAKALSDRGKFLLGTVTDEAGKKMEEFRDSTIDVRFALKGVSDAVAIEVFPSITEATRGMADWIATNRDWLKDNIAGAIKDLSKWLKSIDWSQVGRRLQHFGVVADKVANILGGWQNVVLGIAAIPFLPLASSILQLGVAFLKLGAAAGPLALAAGAAYLAYTNWDKLAPAAKRLREGLENWDWTKISGGFLEFDKQFTKLVQGLVGLDQTGNIQSSMNEFGRALVDWIVKGIGDEVTAMKQFVADMLYNELFPPWMKGSPSGKETSPGSSGSLVAPFMGAGPPTGIGHRAFGGPVQRGGFSIVGERGPELVNWGSSGSVSSNRSIVGALNMLTEAIGRLYDLLATGKGGSGAGAVASGGIGRNIGAGLSSPNVPRGGGRSSSASGFRGPQSTWGSQMARSMGGMNSGVAMTSAERNQLGLILKYESHGRNVMNFMGKQQGLDPRTAKGYTAQGYYQMLNSNWSRIAPGLGIKAPNAMAASFDDQTRVALELLRHGGIGNWANYNPALRNALSKGEQAGGRFAIREPSSFRPAMRASASAGAGGPVQLGRGRVDVRVAVDGPGRVASARSESDGHFDTGVGINRLGRRFWRTDAMAH